MRLRAIVLCAFALLGTGCGSCGGASGPAGTATYTQNCLPLTVNAFDDKTRTCTVAYSTLAGRSHELTVKTGVDHVSTVHVAAKLSVEKGSATVAVKDPDGADHTVTVAPGAPATFEHDVRVQGMRGTKYFALLFAPVGDAPVQGLRADLTYFQK